MEGGLLNEIHTYRAGEQCTNSQKRTYFIHDHRDAIGIVYSKAFGGSNTYGDGRGIFDIGRGAYR